MKQRMLHSRKMRYGGMTVALTVALIAALVLFNVIFLRLAQRFGWYVDMTSNQLYTISDEAHEELSEMLGEAAKTGDVSIDIIFAEDYSVYERGEVGHYIRETAAELAETYPELIHMSWIDCYLDKTLAESYGMRNANSVVLKITRADGSTDSRVFYQQEFFTFEDGNTSSPVGYDGERVFVTSIKTLLDGNRPLVYLSINHDETFYDQTLIYLLRDAGYNIGMIDLYNEPVPEDCALLVTYNPNTDFIVRDGVSDTSELDHLNDYLARGGNYMVFLSANTPVLENFETFLAEWGVSIGRYADESVGKSYNCMVKDDSTALTSDGFTFLATPAASGKGAELVAPLTTRDYQPPIAFRDATALLVAEGYRSAGENAYTAGSRTRTDLFLAGDNASAWASGRELSLDTDALALMSLTTDTASGARVMVCSSVEFAAEDYMQSAVFGNADATLCVAREMGQDNAVVGLHYKPFASSKITSVTTREVSAWTVGLTVAPAVLILGAGLIVLVRRKYS